MIIFLAFGIGLALGWYCQRGRVARERALLAQERTQVGQAEIALGIALCDLERGPERPDQ